MRPRSKAHQAAVAALLDLYRTFARRQPDERPRRYFDGEDRALQHASKGLVDHGLLTPVKHGYVVAEQS